MSRSIRGGFLLYIPKIKKNEKSVMPLEISGFFSGQKLKTLRAPERILSRSQVCQLLYVCNLITRKTMNY